MLGADRAGVVFNKKYDRIPLTLRETFGMDRDVARHLARNYGTRALQVRPWDECTVVWWLLWFIVPRGVMTP